MWCHPMDERRGKIDVENGVEENKVDKHPYHQELPCYHLRDRLEHLQKLLVHVGINNEDLNII